MKKFLHGFYALSILCVAVAAWSCSSGDEPEDNSGKEVSSRFVSGVVLESSYEIVEGEEIEITGSGFADGDYLILRTGSDIIVNPTSLTSSKFTFAVPDEVVSGTSYRFVLRRGLQAQTLGSAKITVLAGGEVPDKDGATIKGMVVCGSKPLSGVLVSDGVTITQTDKNGCYWIESAKKHGSVFVILPSGYEVATENALPQFWQKLTKDQTEVERHDFELFERDNDRYTLLVAADMHLANRSTSDLIQFTTGWVSEVTSQYNNSPTPVYCINLGDLSWDLYWYQNNFGLTEAKQYVKSLEFQFWSVMGNHDNDAKYQGDWQPEQAYRDELGPVFYSMNFGNVHFIMLDDTVYINDGTPSDATVAGSRNYDKYFTEDNLAFVREDLKYVDPSTPIFVCYHCPIKTMAWNAANGWYASDSVSSTYQKSLLSLFSGYQNVTLLSGHTHMNRNVPIEGYAANMMEQNVAGICGTWWWTWRYAANNVCCDGVPAGYKVFDIDGDNISYYYKGIGVDKSKQFQTYDMNKFMEWWNSDSTVSSFKTKLPARANDYSDLSTSSNVVYINVWAYEPSWKVEVTENGKALEVSQVHKYDPLHSASYDIPRGGSGNSLTFPSEYTYHLFSVTASSASSTLEVKVTDSFGNVYSETMTRPKSFSTQYE